MTHSNTTSLLFLSVVFGGWLYLQKPNPKQSSNLGPTQENRSGVISTEDIPSDAPEFSEFPVRVQASQKRPALRVEDDETRMFRTRLRAWAREPVNFAGHYTLATWGCGTLCTQLAIIDAANGRVYHPGGFTTLDATDVYSQLSGGDWYASGAVQFRADSRLLVLIGAPQERTQDRGIAYLLWGEDHKLRQTRFIPKPY